ncbi:MAG TPA: ATP-binding cassette domain-containing protein [Stellaceae bacterium]|nr:ATP-binding cassette domain-containing protein [Stellaceae bacterium]
MTAVAIDRLTLARGRRVVLSEVSAAIEPGEFVGVFGPNGAGKTTLLQAILGLLKPVNGEIRVFGSIPRRGDPAAGYLPQQQAAVSDLRLRGRDFVASTYRGGRWGPGCLGAAGRADIDRALATVEAAELAERPLRELSGGELQRLLLAQALLGKPRLLLLDEPLISLDPRYQQAVVALVKRVQQECGVTVLFTAHDLNPLLGAMDRVLYLGQGRAELGRVAEVVTGPVLSRLYGTPIEVVHIGGRVAVVSGYGPVEAEAHRHDVRL